MYRFIPAQRGQHDMIIKFAQHVRDDVKANLFKISPHASSRMHQRGMDIGLVKDIVLNGDLGLARKIDGQIRCSFYRHHMAVIFAAPFRDFYATPVIVSVIKEGLDEDDDSVTIEELRQPVIEVEVERVKVVEKVVERRVAIEDLTDEELERYATERRQARRTQVLQEATANIERVEKELAELVKQQRTIEGRRTELTDELNKWLRVSGRNGEIEKKNGRGIPKGACFITDGVKGKVLRAGEPMPEGWDYRARWRLRRRDAHAETR